MGLQTAQNRPQRAKRNNKRREKLRLEGLQANGISRDREFTIQKLVEVKFIRVLMTKMQCWRQIGALIPLNLTERTHLNAVTSELCCAVIYMRSLRSRKKEVFCFSQLARFMGHS